MGMHYGLHMTDQILTPSADADESAIQRTYDILVWHCLSTEMNSEQRGDRFMYLSDAMHLIQQIVPKRTPSWDLAHRLKIRASQESVMQRRGEVIIG